MKAMILAAGLGTRLRPLTNDIPKPLLPVGGTSLIVWNLLLLRQHGIHEVMINLHYLGTMIQQALGDGARWDMKLFYSHEPVLLGTGGGLRKAAPFFGNEDFLVLNGDTLIELDLPDLLDFHKDSQACATMVLREDPHVERWGVIETAHDNQVWRINGRGRKATPHPPYLNRLMFAGVHVLHPRVLAHCPTDQNSSIIDAYVAQLESQEKIMGYVHAGYWSDVGTRERYDQAQHDIAAGCLRRDARMVKETIEPMPIEKT